ncbi:RWD-domain-containing protein [Trametes sanguinea]|nr:RWD-domain-containing protein [Trametes sanguinea]
MAASSESYGIESCATLQQDELAVLQSIYPDYVWVDASKTTIRLEIPVELPHGTAVTVQSDLPGESTCSESEWSYGGCDESSSSSEALSLSVLPPVHLGVCLLPTYPYSPPQIRTIHTTHSWLQDDARVNMEKILMALWVEGEGVLYTWAEWIRSGDFLDALHMSATVDGKRVVNIPHPTPGLLGPMLEGFDASTQAARVSATSYECEVCSASVKGARCVMLSCSHVFCRSCLEGSWRQCIKEQDIGRVGCLNQACVEKHQEATEDEVRRVITKEEVAEWKRLRAERALDTDPTTVHCPVGSCQARVPRPENVEEGSPWGRLRTCSECGYSFCAHCRQTWHGPVSQCPVPAKKPQDPGEMPYVRATLKKLVIEPEQKWVAPWCYDWVEQSLRTPCPTCDLPVATVPSSDHVICTKCEEQYCYRCGTRLDRKQPSKHFSTQERCLSKVF